MSPVLPNNLRLRFDLPCFSPTCFSYLLGREFVSPYFLRRENISSSVLTIPDYNLFPLLRLGLMYRSMLVSNIYGTENLGVDE